MNRNEAPVSVELPSRQHALATQPLQKTPSKGDTSTDTNQTPSIIYGLQATIKKPAEETRDRWKGSNESQTVLFADPYTSPTLSPGSSEKCNRDKVSPCWQDSQAGTAVKTVKETKVELQTKAECEEVHRLLEQPESQALHEKVKIETKGVDHIKPTEQQDTKADKDVVIVVMKSSGNHDEGTSTSLKKEENTTLDLQRTNVMFNKSDSVAKLHSLKDSNLPNFQMEDCQEVQKPVVKVESVAELLRMQIKALDSILTHSASIIPAPDNMLSHSNQMPKETYKDSKENGKCENEVKDSMSERGNRPNNEDTPPKNLKDTLMELYHQLICDRNQPVILKAPAQASEKTNLITHVVNVLPTSPDVSAKNYKTVNCLENGTSNGLLDQSQHVIQESGSPVTVTPKKLSGQESSNAVLKCDKDETVHDKDSTFIQKTSIESKLNSKPQTGTQQTAIFDQYKLDEPNREKSYFLSAQKPSTKAETQTDYSSLIQKDNTIVEELSRIDGMANSTTVSSPLLEKRNGVSVIPSATAQELASGARRKVQMQKTKPEGESAEVFRAISPIQPKEDLVESTKLSTSPVAISPSPRQSRRSTQLQPLSELASPSESYSPLLGRRKTPPETESQPLTKDIYTAKPEGNPGSKDRKELHDPFKGTIHIYFYHN